MSAQSSCTGARGDKSCWQLLLLLLLLLLVQTLTCAPDRHCCSRRRRLGLLSLACAAMPTICTQRLFYQASACAACGADPLPPSS
jgi:hypothetical protein